MTEWSRVRPKNDGRLQQPAGRVRCRGELDEVDQARARLFTGRNGRERWLAKAEQGNQAGVIQGMSRVVQIVVQFRGELQGDRAEKLQGQQSTQHPEPEWGAVRWS